MNVRVTTVHALLGAALFCASAAPGLARPAQEAPAASGDVEIPEGFRRFDANGDGALSDDEKRAAIATLREEREAHRAKRRRAASEGAAPATGGGVADRSAPMSDAASARQGETRPARRAAAADKARGVQNGAEANRELAPRAGATQESAARRAAAAAAAAAKAREAEAQEFRARALEQARRELEEEAERREELREQRREAVLRVVHGRREKTSVRQDLVRTYATKRDAKLGEDMAYRYMSRFKSPAIKAPKRSFKPVNRQGVQRGKKRGSAYYQKKIQEGLRRGRGGRGGRRGGGGFNNNNNF